VASTDVDLPEVVDHEDVTSGSATAACDEEMSSVATMTHIYEKRTGGSGNQLTGVPIGGCSAPNNKVNGDSNSPTGTNATALNATPTSPVPTSPVPTSPLPTSPGLTNLAVGITTNDDDYSPNHVVYKKVIIHTRTALESSKGQDEALSISATTRNALSER